jgi:hypothetical protein
MAGGGRNLTDSMGNEGTKATGWPNPCSDDVEALELVYPMLGNVGDASCFHEIGFCGDEFPLGPSFSEPESDEITKASRDNTEDINEWVGEEERSMGELSNNGGLGVPEGSGVTLVAGEGGN